MQKNDIIQAMKDNGTTVQKVANRYGISRQTMYTYIDHFIDGRLEKIPKEVYDYLVTISGEPPAGIETRNLIKDHDEDEEEIDSINSCTYAIAVAKQEIENLKSRPRYLERNESEEERNEVEKHIYELEQFIESQKREIEEISKNKMERKMKFPQYDDESIDARIERLVKEGKYGGPNWQGTSRSTSNAICIAEGGEYMVITDDLDLGGGKSELFLYAVIAGKRVHIATYKFKENESFVKFSLIPKLSYFFEVKSYAFGEEYSTGILELTSCV